MPSLKKFGPFEVDVDAGQLRKHGTRIRLQDQPFRLLALLLERPGEVVSREELREKLWPADTFVEFEHSLNTAVNRLRSALRDSASEPLFIETIPRRGYRFIGKLDVADIHEPVPPKAEPAGRNIAVNRRLALAAAFSLIAIAFAVFAWTASASRAASSGVVDWPLRKYRIFAHAEGIAEAVISPNGEYVACITQDPKVKLGLWLHTLRSGEYRLLTSASSRNMFWSPGSDFLAYSWLASILWKIPVTGGTPFQIGEIQAPDVTGAWMHDGGSLLLASRRLHTLSAGGGNVTPLETGDCDFRAPHALPIEGHMLVTVDVAGEPEIHLLDLSTMRGTKLVQGERGVWSPTGHIVYESQRSIWAVPFSLTAKKTTGAAFLVHAGGTRPSVSEDGTLVFLVKGEGQHLLVWLDRRGDTVGKIGEPQEIIWFPDLSPDERSVVALGGSESDLEIWIHSTERAQKRRMTFDPSKTDRPVWSPKGDRIAFTSWRSGGPDIYTKDIEGDSEERFLARSGYGHGWSPGEEHFVLTRPSKTLDIVPLSRKPDGTGFQEGPALGGAIRDRITEHAPVFSPDGKYVAYCSDESGQAEVYVEQFPGGDRKKLLSEGGGCAPRWRSDGKEIYYIRPTSPPSLVAVDVASAAGGIRFGSATTLFSTEDLVGSEQTYDVSKDGQRFVVSRAVKKAPPTEVHVVQNWYAEFQERR